MIFIAFRLRIRDSIRCELYGMTMQCRRRPGVQCSVRRTRLGCRKFHLSEEAEIVPRILSPRPTTKASFSKKNPLNCGEGEISPCTNPFSSSPENSGKRVTFFALFPRSRETDPSWLSFSLFLFLSLSSDLLLLCSLLGNLPPFPLPLP